MEPTEQDIDDVIAGWRKNTPHEPHRVDLPYPFECEPILFGLGERNVAARMFRKVNDAVNDIGEISVSGLKVVVTPTHTEGVLTDPDIPGVEAVFIIRAAGRNGSFTTVTTRDGEIFWPCARPVSVLPARAFSLDRVVVMEPRLHQAVRELIKRFCDDLTRP